MNAELSTADCRKALHSVQEYPIHKIRQSPDGTTRFVVWTADRRMHWSKNGIHRIRISGRIKGNTLSVRVSPGADAYIGLVVFLAALIYGLFGGDSAAFCLVGLAAIFFICGTAFFQCRNCLKSFLNKIGVKESWAFSCAAMVLLRRNEKRNWFLNSTWMRI